MCELHTHAKMETWITPESSRHLSAKMIGLFPGEAIPDHTTGPEREEVIVCVYGTIEVAFDSRIEIVTSGNAVFIPENTHHAVLNNSDAPAQYAYVATKREAAERARMDADMLRVHRAYREIVRRGGPSPMQDNETAATTH